MSALRISRSAAAAAALLLLAGCGPRTHVAPIVRANEGSFDVITSFRIQDGQALQRHTQPLPPSAYRFGWFVSPSPGVTPRRGGHRKIHPVLLQRLALGPSTVTEEVLVTYQDTLHVPRFATFVPGVTTTPADTSAKIAAASTQIQSIIAARSAQSDSDSAAVAQRFAATMVDRTFWLTRSQLIRLPRDSVPALARMPGVVYVRPARAGEEPPQMNTTTIDDPSRVRWWMQSDPYYVTSLQRGKIALLDTGIRFDHQILNHTGQFDLRGNCITGNTQCEVYVASDAYDISPGDGHGTMSAGILNGELSGNDAVRGLTQITIDSYRIYAAAPTGTNYNYGPSEPDLDAPALQHCLENVLGSFSGVIAVEAQAEEDDLGPTSLAADQAFDGGAVIVAANGNNDVSTGPLEVRAPGNARRVLGIGGYSVRYGDDIVEQINGPANDLRIKPDLQAPTNYETGSNLSTSSYSDFGGTSGATASAAGAAALFRNLLLDESESVDPGYVYAGLIACGDQSYPFNNTNGAGHFRLPNDAWYWMVKLSLSHGEISDVPVDITGLNLASVAAGIWWPERAAWSGEVALDTHSEVALTLTAEDSGGRLSATSRETESVFQRANFQVASPLTKLTATVSADKVRSGPQTIYLVVLGYNAP
jgi:hypothetical protein